MQERYASDFSMPNYRNLRDAGVFFSNATLGFLASEATIAHGVLATGSLPKNIGLTGKILLCVRLRWFFFVVVFFFFTVADAATRTTCSGAAPANFIRRAT